MGSELAGPAATPMTWLRSVSSSSPRSGGNRSQPDPSAARSRRERPAVSKRQEAGNVRYLAAG
jgi:hypothetical protein